MIKRQIIDNTTNVVIEPKKIAVKAKKISSEDAKHVSLFLKTLGVKDDITIYIYNSKAYFNYNILEILNVEISTFLKTADKVIHFIKIKRELYINKYGLTKVLSCSKEPIAFKLQDYLFELLYKVETNTFTCKEDLKNRNEYIIELSKYNKLKESYDILEDELYTIKEEKVEINEKLQNIICDYSIIEEENEKLKLKISLLEDEKNHLEQEYEHIRKIASKLACHVRFKSKEPPIEAYNDELSDDEYTTYEIKEAKQELKSISKKIKYPEKTFSKQIIPYKKYSILRSKDSIESLEYKWEITDKEISEDIKELSRNYILDGKYFPHEMIWYTDVKLSDEKMKAIKLFISVKEYFDESIMTQLI
jgi:hypothetical protein